MVFSLRVDRMAGGPGIGCFPSPRSDNLWQEPSRLDSGLIASPGISLCYDSTKCSDVFQKMSSSLCWNMR